jgi:hypothetical protein
MMVQVLGYVLGALAEAGYDKLVVVNIQRLRLAFDIHSGDKQYRVPGWLGAALNSNYPQTGLEQA